jgi:hypothetical protein
MAEMRQTMPSTVVAELFEGFDARSVSTSICSLFCGYDVLAYSISIREISELFLPTSD